MSENQSKNDPWDLKHAIGWDANINLYLENVSAEQKIIKLARQTVSLSKIIFNYNIKFTIKNFPGINWTHSANCPFPDHSDRSPSFGYNSIDHCFKCFGCNRAGGSVEFLSAISGKSTLESARYLLATYQPDQDVIEILNDDPNIDLDPILFSFSRKILSFRREFPQHHKICNQLLWFLDCQIEANVFRGTLTGSKLEIWTEYLLNYLQELR